MKRGSRSSSKSAAWAGATAASSVIATIIGAWVGGGLVDRFGRAPVALISGVVGGVAMASIPLLDAVGALSNTGLIACVVLGAAFDAPGMAAQDSELPKLGHVAGLSVERVSSLKAVIGNVAILGGPALGGAAIGLLGAAPTLGLTAFCSVLAGLLGAWVLPARAARTMTTTATLSMRAGVAFLWSEPRRAGAALPECDTDRRRAARALGIFAGARSEHEHSQRLLGELSHLLVRAPGAGATHACDPAEPRGGGGDPQATAPRCSCGS